MHVLESFAHVAQRSKSYLVRTAREERVLSIRIINATSEVVSVAGDHCFAGTLDVHFKELQPGEVGRLRFASRPDSPLTNMAHRCHHGGALALDIGDETVMLTEAHWMGQSMGMAKPCFHIAIVEKEDTPLLTKACSQIPDGFMGKYGSEEAEEVRGEQFTARAHAVVSDYHAEVDIRLVSNQELMIEFNLSDTEQLKFAEWCSRRWPSMLGRVLFLIEWHGLTHVLLRCFPHDTAYAVDLLISTFVMTRMLDIPLEPLARELENWHWHKKPEALRHHVATKPDEDFQCCDYSVYAPLENSDDLGEYIHVGLSILSMVAYRCSKSLKDAINECKESGGWPAADDEEASDAETESQSPSPPGSARRSKRQSTLSRTLGAESPSSAGGGSRYRFFSSMSRMSTRSRSQLPSDLALLIQECIHSGADFGARRLALLDRLIGLQTSSKMRDAIQHYRAKMVLSTRTFSVQQGDDLLTPIQCQTFHTIAFATLDGGRLTSPARVLESLGLHAGEYISLRTNSRSGEFFYFSADRRFLVKTISKKECQRISKCTAKYHHHIQSRSRSLVVRIAGLYRLEVPNASPIHFMIMANVCNPTYRMDETYDLKGSTHGRKKKEGESVGKDEDWLEEGRCLRVPAAMRRELCEVHEEDLRFLQSLKVMDYSLLIGLRDRFPDEAKCFGWLPDGGFSILDCSTVCYMGIIDYTIKYGIGKEAENMLKKATGVSDDVSSCVSEDAFAKRQVSFLRDHVLQKVPPEEDFGTLGLLKVELKEASNLIAADWIGTSDPYVVVTLGLVTRQTEALKRTCAPKFDTVLYLPVNKAHQNEVVDISLWDQDEMRAMRGSDDFLGRWEVPMERFFIMSRFDMVNAPLADTRKGRLTLSLSFQPLPAHTSPEPEPVLMELNTIVRFLLYWEALPREAQHRLSETSDEGFDKLPERRRGLLHAKTTPAIAEEQEESEDDAHDCRDDDTSSACMISEIGVVEPTRLQRSSYAFLKQARKMWRHRSSLP